MNSVICGKNSCFSVNMLLCFAMAKTGAAAVLSGPVVNPTNNHLYFLITSQSWSASQAEAAMLGGSLATINDAGEDTWVFDTFATPTRMLWVGLNDVASEGQFVWSSGEPVGYTNWAQGEPQGGLTENWVAIRTQALGPARKWIDWQDNGNFFGTPVHGVVEVAVPEPATSLMVLIAGMLSTFAGIRCRQWT